MILNTLPTFLEEVAKALSPDDPKSVASEGNTLPMEHGRERARWTRFSLPQVLHEYAILRMVLFQILEPACTLEPEHRRIIHESIDRAMGEAAEGFTGIHDEIRDRFVLTLTHDLRGPLTAAKMSAQLILRHPDGSERLRLLAARVVDSMNRADWMIQDLLDTSRVRAGERLTLEVSQCELRDLVAEVLEELASTHGDRFAIRAAGECEGYWSRANMQRAIYNLVTNAIKYGDPHGRITVAIHPRPEIGRVELSVHNEGNPIPRDDQEHLFELYRRSRSAEQGGQRGWGLGLALVRGVAEAHGGTIALESTPEKGTTFLLDLPIDSRPFVAAKSAGT